MPRLDDPTPDEIRARMREVFERAEFRRSRSWPEKFLDWLGRRFGGGGSGGAGSAWGGSIGSVVGWVAIVLAALGLAAIVYVVVRNWRPGVRRQRRARPTPAEIEELRTATEWASDADRLEAAGAWKDAIRCRYRELVARLVDAGAAAPLAGRTTGELRRDIAESAPDVSRDFSAATGLFELPWYADAPTGPAELDEFKALAARVLERVT